MCFHLFHSHEVSNNLYSSTVSTCNKYPLYKRTLKWLCGRYQRLVLKIVIWLILYCFRASGYITCPLNANSQPKYHFITWLRVKDKLCPTLSPRATSGTDIHVFPLSIVSRSFQLLLVYDRSIQTFISCFSVTFDLESVHFSSQ